MSRRLMTECTSAEDISSSNIIQIVLVRISQNASWR